MITKAIIKQIINKYQAKVYIPLYNNGNSPEYFDDMDNLYVATICSPPGFDPHYMLNDIVYVDFEEDRTNKPIILGILYRDNAQVVSHNSGVLKSVTVDVDCTLPYETKIGKTTAKDLSNCSKTKGNLQEQINLCEQKIEEINKEELMKKLLDYGEQIAAMQQQIQDLQNVEM